MHVILTTSSKQHFYGVRIDAGERKHFITTGVVSIWPRAFPTPKRSSLLLCTRSHIYECPNGCIGKCCCSTKGLSSCMPMLSKPPARGLRGVPKPKPTSEADLVSDVLCPHKPTPPQDATASPPIRFCLQPLSNPPVHNWPHRQEKPWVERILLHQQVCVLGPLLLG